MNDFEFTKEQIQELNEKHGWFRYRDANSDVSKAFAEDAVAIYERVRTAAPKMLVALEGILALELDDGKDAWDHALTQAALAVKEANGDFT